jgi:hypothetical protein
VSLFISVFSQSLLPRSFDKASRKPFLIACNKVVLANGGSDLVNRLGVRGESKSLSWLKYELPLLENVIESLKPEEKINIKPVMIVGAGLSAADAVIACRNAGIDVIHVFRSVAGGFVRLIVDQVFAVSINFWFHSSSACPKLSFPSTTWCSQ